MVEACGLWGLRPPALERTEVIGFHPFEFWPCYLWGGLRCAGAAAAWVALAAR
jgi:hypothetical protein